MKIILPGGNGQVGRMLVRAFVREGHECIVLTRGRAVPPEARAVVWDGRTLGPWANELEGADVVINLAGRSVDCRYHERNLAEMMRSRVDSTRAIGQGIAAAKNPPRVWLQMSTATIYAHRFDAPNDETTGIIGGSEPGVPALWARSIDIARAWEAQVEAAVTPRTRKVILRSAMVMSPDRGGVFCVLARLARFGAGAQGDGRQFVSWIHEGDFVAAVNFLIVREDLAGVFNLCSPHPLPNRDFMAALHHAVGRRLSVAVPRWALEIGAFFIRTETELILKSRRVIPGRLVKEGFRFSYPDWQGAAGELVQRGEARSQNTMKLTRGRRIALELLGPPLAGGVLVTIWAWSRQAYFSMYQYESIWEAAGLLCAIPAMWLLYGMFAFPMVGLQAAGYTAIMEWRFSRGLDPRSWRSVVLSSVLGYLSGLPLAFGYGYERKDTWYLFNVLGVVVGLGLGLLIRKWTAHPNQRSAGSPTER